ncbi:MAG: hypothetical protein ACLUD0_04810 [Eubacterium ramulus]
MAVKQAAEWSDKVEQILKLFPVHIRKVMEQAEVFQRLSQKLEEIRVRVNQPLELVLMGILPEQWRTGQADGRGNSSVSVSEKI